MPPRFALLPHVRSALTAAARAPADGQRRLQLAYDLEIRVAEAVTSSAPRLPVRTALRGPGDVIGFHRRIITRVEPEPGLRGFEPNYLPFVEFADADFPWRYSLDTSTGDTGTRIRPWLALLTLKPEEFEFAEQGRGPFPRIRVTAPAGSLPDLAHSWAHAHAQVALTEADSSDPDAVRTALADPAASFSRLLAPRRLAETTVYHLFLVPAYEAGRRAGLGLEGGSVDPYDAPAWEPASGDPVELPVYFQSRLTTSALEDMETMLRRLRGLGATEAADLTPTSEASAERPGYYPDYQKPGARLDLHAALHQPDAATPAFATDPDLADRLAATLEAVIAGERVAPGADGPEDEDPLLAMPAYGWRFRGTTALSRSQAQERAWFDLLNLDLGLRHAAGLGAATVQRDQELFAGKCFEQYAQVLAANRQLQRLGHAQALVQRLTGRRVAALPADAALRLAEPLHPYVTVTAEHTVLAELHDSGAPTGFTGRGIRRLAAKRPTRLPGQDPRWGPAVPTPRIPGDRTPDPRIHPGEPTPRPAPPPMLDPHVARGLAEVLGDDPFAGVRRPRGVPVPLRGLESAALADAVAAAVTRLPAAKARVTVAGLHPAEQDTLQPVYRCPVVPLPLVKWLQRDNPDHLLAGAQLPDNTVAAFQENRTFLEAFLVGANHAINHELRWREFPTDLRGSVFRRFWDRGRAPDDPAGDDIAPIHTWTRRLGEHPSARAADHEPDLVIVIRGDVIAKFGQLVAVLNEAADTEWASGQGIDHAPAFFGRLDRDVAYYGFDVPRRHVLSPGVRERMFLVLHEPVGRLRFGLDIATAAVRRQRRDYASLALGFPLAALARSYDQLPARPAARSAPPPAQPAGWDDLSWSHLPPTPAGYLDFTRTLDIPGQPDDYWGAERTSATIARSLWQKPLAAVLPLSRLL